MEKKKVVKGFFFLMFLPITGIYVLVKNVLLSLMRLGKMLFIEGPARFRQSMVAAQKQLKEQNVNEKPNFAATMKAWGIKNEKQLVEKKRELLFRIGCWLVLFVAGISVLVLNNWSFSSLCSFLLLSGTAFVGLTSSLWRWQVLAERRFVFFTDWIQVWRADA